MKEQILKEIEELKLKFEKDNEKNNKRNVDAETKQLKAGTLKRQFDSDLKALEEKLKNVSVEGVETYDITVAEKWQSEGRKLIAIVRVEPFKKLYRFEKGN